MYNQKTKEIIYKSRDKHSEEYKKYMCLYMRTKYDRKKINNSRMKYYYLHKEMAIFRNILIS